MCNEFCDLHQPVPSRASVVTDDENRAAPVVWVYNNNNNNNNNNNTKFIKCRSDVRRLQRRGDVEMYTTIVVFFLCLPPCLRFVW